MDLVTAYGTWSGVRTVNHYPSGTPEQALLTEPCVVKFPFGKVIPLYSVVDSGRRRETPVLFYENGKIKSLPLQMRVAIETSVGAIPAELLTFHKTGELKKIFPSAGKLTGFWTEEHEAEEAPRCEFTVGEIVVKAKVISIQFYPSGAVQSVTLWPQERLQIPVPWGVATVRTGMSFYEDGALQSFEPANPTPVPSEIGTLMAFDSHPIGVSADRNSLYFAPDGQILSLLTMSSKIEVTSADGSVLRFAPKTVISFCEEADTEMRPLHIRFQEDRVAFGTDPSHVFPLDSTKFSIESNSAFLAAACCQS